MLKKIASIVLTLCLVAGLAFGATRQEIQVALDLIRFTNIANDLFDVTTSIARGQIKKQEGVFPNLTERDMTTQEIKDSLVRMSENILGYRDKITAFLATSKNRTLAINGLAELGVDVTSLESDIQSMENAAKQLKSRAKNAITQTDLNKVGDYIEQTIPKLSLVRRAK